MFHNQLNTFDTCLRCHSEEETWTHLPRCRHPEMQRVCNLEIIRIRRDMRRVHTEPKLEHHLLQYIRSVIERTNCRIPDNNEELRDAHIHQNSLVWSNFMKGLWSDKQEKYQHQHYVNMPEKDNKCNIDVWSKRMVQTMFALYRALWKERCDIYQATKSGTLDARIREKTHLYCKQLLREIQKLNVRDRHLIRKSRGYFASSSITQILAWEKRVNNALMRERRFSHFKRKQISDVFRGNACLPINLPPRNKPLPNTTIINTMRRYRQTLLPFAIQFRTSTSASISNNTISRTHRSRTARQRQDQRREERGLRQVQRLQTQTGNVHSVITGWVNNMTTNT